MHPSPYRNLWSQQRRQVHGPQRFILSLILVTASVTVPTRIKDVHCLFSSDCKDIPTQFDVLFRSQGFLFRYQLQFLKGNIAEENLFYGSLGGSDTGILFNRKESVIHPGRELISFPLKAVPPSVTLLSCSMPIRTPCTPKPPIPGSAEYRAAVPENCLPMPIHAGAVRYSAGFGT